MTDHKALPPSSASPLRLIREGPFARLWWASLLSSTGDWVALFATLALAGRIGAGANRGGEAATLVPLVARLLPALFFAAIFGVLADRVNRKRLMVLGDIARGSLVLMLAFVDTLVMLFVVSLVLELFSIMWQPAKEATVPNLVRPDSIVIANTLGLSAAYGTFPLGAAIFFGISKLPQIQIGGPEALAFFADSVSFFGSALLIATIPIRQRLPEKAREGRFDLRAPLQELRAGVRFVTSHPVVRPVVFGMAIALFGGGVLFALGESFARRTLHADDSGFAALLFGLGLGAAVGVLTGGTLARRFKVETVYGVSLLAAGGGLIATSLADTVAGAALWIFLVGVGTGGAYVTGFTLLHRRVSDDFRGRTFAALIALLRTGLLASLALAGATAQFLGNRFAPPFQSGTRNVISVGGIIVLVTGLITLRNLGWTLPRTIAEEARRSMEEAADVYTSLSKPEKDSTK